LEKACLLHRVASVHPNGLPLGAEASDKHFKLIFLDIGLGQRWAGFSTREIMDDQNLLDVYEGRLAEQFVAQQLLAESDTACEGRNLYCWIRTDKSASAEVDFILVREGSMIGVEVRSGPSGKLKSMFVLQKSYPHIKDLLCLQDRSTSVTDRGILSMPLYTVL
jgi:predicted AAA+ superfamily ATPase